MCLRENILHIVQKLYENSWVRDKYYHSVISNI